MRDSDFRCQVSEKRALMDNCAASSGSLLTRFWEVYFYIIAWYTD